MCFCYQVCWRDQRTCVCLKNDKFVVQNETCLNLSISEAAVELFSQSLPTAAPFSIDPVAHFDRRRF